MKVAETFILLAVVMAISSAMEEKPRDERLFAYYSTTSITKLTTITTTGISTCLSTATPSCYGRRKRAVFPEAVAPVELEDVFKVELAGSQAEETEVRHERSAPSEEREGKKLTIWSTAYTTLTITSTSILPSTTVTVSALCLVSGVSQTCFST